MRNKVEPEPKLNNSGFATLLTKFSCILRDYKYFVMFPCLLKMSPLDIHSKRLVSVLYCILYSILFSPVDLISCLEINV